MASVVKVILGPGKVTHETETVAKDEGEKHNVKKDQMEKPETVENEEEIKGEKEEEMKKEDDSEDEKMNRF